MSDKIISAFYRGDGLVVNTTDGTIEAEHVDNKGLPIEEMSGADIIDMTNRNGHFSMRYRTTDGRDRCLEFDHS